jgi:hypothetical protein
MKSITNRLFLFAATAMFLGTTAFGQTTLKADIPFAFHVPGGGVSGGKLSIQLRNAGNGKIANLYNYNSHSSALAVTYKLWTKSGEAAQPRLVFRCGDNGCMLSEIWTLDGGYGVPQGKPGAHEYLTSIPLAEKQGN